MTHREKRSVKKVLGKGLSRDREDLPSPTWHKVVLDHRRVNTALFRDWESVKSRIRDERASRRADP